MITNEQAIELLRRWEIDWTPRYRGYTCARCGKTIEKAWHIHCEDGEFKREIHLCRDCGLVYDMKIVPNRKFSKRK